MEETFLRDMVYFWHARCDKFVKKDIRTPKTDLHTTKETYQYEKRLIEETCRRDMVYFWHMRCDKCVKRDICTPKRTWNQPYTSHKTEPCTLHKTEPYTLHKTEPYTLHKTEPYTLHKTPYTSQKTCVPKRDQSIYTQKETYKRDSQTRSRSTCCTDGTTNVPKETYTKKTLRKDQYTLKETNKRQKRPMYTKKDLYTPKRPSEEIFTSKET